MSPYFCQRLVAVRKKVFSRKFFGYVLYVWGIWKGDTVVADIEVRILKGGRI